MISVGVDSHKEIHVAVALSEQGRVVGEWSGGNTASAWSSFGEWLVVLGEERQVGIEGSGSYGYGLSRSLLQAGETVYEVNSRLTTRERRRAVKRGKSDRLDAQAVAKVVLEAAEQLPKVTHNEEAQILAHLSEERETLVQDGNRVRNRLHSTLLKLDPEYKTKTGALRALKNIVMLESYTGPAETALEVELAKSVRRLAGQLKQLTESAEVLGREIEARAAEYSELETITGVGPLTAGTLAGILGSCDRFESDAQLASYAGVAPLEASSAGNGRHRLNRTGNRKLNAIVYRIAISQLRHPGEGREYMQGAVSRGKSKREAIRSLKRYIIRRIWKQWNLIQARATPRTSFACP